MASKILVVDDERELRELMQELLDADGYKVEVAADGREGLKLFFAGHPDLVVLDLMMPQMDGWDLLERIREVSETPVIILTALGREHEKVKGLKAGADDYVVKPFQKSEFLARVQAALRRSRSPQPTREVYQDPVLTVDYPQHQVYLGGAKVDLTAQEFRLLAALVQNPNRVMSTDRLLDLCWGEGFGGPENVRVYIGYLRKKLRDDAKTPRLIETVREFGYCYRPPPEKPNDAE